MTNPTCSSSEECRWQGRSCGAWLVFAGLFVGVMTACGGTEEEPCPEPPTEIEPSAVDLRSCEDLVEAFEFTSVESFETGSVHDTQEARVGWWVSHDGTNTNFTPYDNTQVDVGCQTDPNGPNDCRDLFPRDGGAPSILPGEGQCEATGHGMQLVSGAPGFSAWGFSFGANLKPPLNDATEWDGVAFWAKHGPDSDVNTFLAALPDQYTTNQGGTYFCRDGLYISNLCDPFGRGIAVDDEWRFYVLPFDQLYQQGFGKASPLGMVDVANIVQLGFQLGAGTWDIWIDEIVYFRERDE